MYLDVLGQMQEKCRKSLNVKLILLMKLTTEMHRELNVHCVGRIR